MDRRNKLNNSKTKYAFYYEFKKVQFVYNQKWNHMNTTENACILKETKNST